MNTDVNEETKRRKTEYGFVRNANRCGNCFFFKRGSEQQPHCSKGAFATNPAAICNFYKSKAA